MFFQYFVWFFLTYPWLFQSVQNSLTGKCLPIFQVFQVFQSEWEPCLRQYLRPSTSITNFWWFLLIHLTWMLLAFCPHKFWEMVGTYELVLRHSVNVGSMVGTLRGGRGPSNPTCCNWIYLIFLSSEAVGNLQHLPRAPHAPRVTLWNFHNI